MIEIFWLSLGAFVFAVVDVLVKSLGGRFDPLQISMFRDGYGFIFLIPLFVQFGFNNLQTDRLRIHVLRMFLAFAAQHRVFVTVINMPLFLDIFFFLKSFQYGHVWVL